MVVSGIEIFRWIVIYKSGVHPPPLIKGIDVLRKKDIRDIGCS